VITRPGRVVCGIGTVYGQPSPNDGRSWSAAQFDEFVSLEVGLPLRVDHGILLNSHGVIASVGTVRRFQHITFPTKGLLILAEIGSAEGFGDQLLSDLTSMTQQSWLPQTWGLSVGALLAEDGAVWPYEFSICRRPAFSDCKILGVGVEAINVWDLLTERQVAA
jgi:hypothetical protein